MHQETSPSVNAENPFAPPQSIEELDRVSSSSAELYRDGNLLVVQDGADLPPFCFISNQPISTFFDWKTAYAPKWHFVLILCGILPYFIIGPFLITSVRIRVPLASKYVVMVEKRQRLVSRLYFASFCLLVTFFSGVGTDAIAVTLMASAVGTFLVALVLRKGGNYLGLRIVQKETNQIWVAGVHSGFLSRLPPY